MRARLGLPTRPTRSQPARDDPVRRQAARVASLVAIPVALAVGAAIMISFGAFGGPAGPSDTAPPVASSPPPSSPSSAAALPAVGMDAPALASDTARICRDLIARLPDTVLDRPRRPVTAGAGQNAAYGEPPLTLQCGATQATFSPTEQVFGLSGVCWYARPGATGTVWTTVDRVVPVRVSVPGAPDGSAQVVITFTAAIIAADPAVSDTPTGCNP